MADISKITLPSGNTYNIKDQTARDAIAALEGGSYFLGVTVTPLTDQCTTTPINIGTASDPIIRYPSNGNMVVYGQAEFVFTSPESTKGSIFRRTAAEVEPDQDPLYYYVLVSNPTQAQRDAAVHAPAVFPTDEQAAGSEEDFPNEYIYTESGKWAEFGDLSTLGQLAYYDENDLQIDTELSKQTDVVLGEATTFTSSSSSVSGSGTVPAVSTSTSSAGKATVLKSDVTASVGTGVTVTPTTTNIKATASGTAVGANGTASVIGNNATLSTTVTPITTQITGEFAISDLQSALSKESFLKSYPGVTQKLSTTSITPATAGTAVVDSVTPTSKKLTTKSIKAVNGVGSASTWAFTVSSETLTITGTNSTVPTTTNETVATGALSATSATTNVGSTIVESVASTKNVTPAAVGTAVTVATGSVGSTGGASVMTGLGTASTGNAVTGVTGTTIPVGIAETSEGDIEVVTGILSASTTFSSKDTKTALTGVKVTAQPTVSLSTGATAGTGVIEVATGITSAALNSGAVTINTSGKTADVLTSIPAQTVNITGTAAAQPITVGTNDKVTVLKSTTDVSSTYSWQSE